MKKTALCAMCVLLLCGGLLCVHLTAQSGGIENIFSAAVSSSLLDMKTEELTERELLELKVANRRQLADNVAHLATLGAPVGTASRLAEVHADLAAAEIELYRYTGEQEKLFTALKTRVDALTDKLRAETFAHKLGARGEDAIPTAEIQLLDALLEQKRERCNP